MEKNTLLYNMIDTVISNEDTFSWKDLNCVYRPWSTALKSFGEEYLEGTLLLSAFFSIYTPRKTKREIPNFPVMYEAELQNYFGIQVKKACYVSKHEMAAVVKEAIDKGCPVVLPVDLYELNYNPMYKKEHRFKYMIIKGYDLEREIYHILDNIHIDYGSATILTDFTNLFDEMYRMNQSYYTYFHELQDCDDQHLFYLEGDKRHKINAYQTLTFLKEKLMEIQQGSLPFVHFEETMAKMEIGDNCKEDMEELTKSLNLKHVFVETLFVLLERLSRGKEALKELKEELEQINKEWNTVKTEIVYHKVRDSIPYELEMRIKQIKEREGKAGKTLIQILDSIEEKEDKQLETMLGFEVLNSKKAEIEQAGNDIIVKHSNHTTYDTWLMQDYAVQLLLRDISRPMVLETKVDVRENIADDIHSGIILKIADGARYLFGNYRGERVALFCPNMGDAFELYNRLNFDYNSAQEQKSNHYFKVAYTGQAIDFYCLNKDTLQEECIYHLETEEKIVALGLFSKTWEKLNHEVRFYDINKAGL